MESITICNELPKEKIFAPKAKRLFPKNKNSKIKKSSKRNKYNLPPMNISTDFSSDNEKEINLDNISFDEINKDFETLNEKLEENKCYDEIFNILKYSYQDENSDIKIHFDYDVKRPKNISKERFQF